MVRVAKQPDHEIEVHCHGGIAAVERIISQLVASGCVRVEETAGAHGSHAELQSESLTIEQEAHIALQHATTEKAALILLDQLNGALTTKVQSSSRISRLWGR